MTFSTQEFEQAPCEAERAAQNGPVFLTERGLPTLVLLKAEEYFRLAHQGKRIGDLLACPEAAEIDFDPPRMDLDLRAAEFD
jgi:hypothetical protein